MNVGIAGFGNVGQSVARSLAAGLLDGVSLTAVTARNLDKARRAAETISRSIAVVSLQELPDLCDLVLECATADALPDIARATLGAGNDLICVSAGGCLKLPELGEMLKASGACIQIANGAVPGLDILRSAAEGNIHTVHLKSRIKVASLAKEPYVLAQGFDFDTHPPREPVRVFNGTAREAARCFPRHLNVAVSLSLAGIGYDRTTIELWVDPTISGSVNELEVHGEEISLTMVSRNVPSLANPKTSRIVSLSVLAALRAQIANIRVGS